MIPTQKEREELHDDDTKGIDLPLWFWMLRLFVFICFICSVSFAFGAKGGEEMAKVIGTHRVYVSKDTYDQFVKLDQERVGKSHE